MRYAVSQGKKLNTINQAVNEETVYLLFTIVERIYITGDSGNQLPLITVYFLNSELLLATFEDLSFLLNLSFQVQNIC